MFYFFACFTFKIFRYLDISMRRLEKDDTYGIFMIAHTSMATNIRQIVDLTSALFSLYHDDDSWITVSYCELFLWI